MRNVSQWVTAAALVVVGCGGNGNDVTSVTGGGGGIENSTPSASGGSGGIGGSTTSVTGGGGSKICRKYLIQGTVTSPAGSGTASAAFDPETLTYSETYGFGAIQLVQSTVYASLEDFVMEPKIVGRILWTQQTLTGAVQQLTTCTFDANKRLVKKDLIDYAGTDGTTIISAWDAQGRPTQGLLTANPAELDCSNMTVSLSYDDSARRRTEKVEANTGVGTACPKSIYGSYEVVDAEGIVIEMAHPGETTPTLISVTQTAEQCLP